MTLIDLLLCELYVCVCVCMLATGMWGSLVLTGKPDALDPPATTPNSAGSVRRAKGQQTLGTTHVVGGRGSAAAVMLRQERGVQRDGNVTVAMVMMDVTVVTVMTVVTVVTEQVKGEA